MTAYPVHYFVEKTARFTRIQLAIRIVALIALGLVGISLGLVLIVAYLALPAYAATRLASGRAAAEYFERDGARITRGLAWFAAIYSWFALVADRLPAKSPDETVRVEVQPMGNPTAASALWRLLVGLPSALVLAILGWLGGLVWLWSALRILLTQRMGRWSFDYLAGLQRWTVRLLAYQASLVDVYPPFSFDDAPPALPAAPAPSRG